MSAERIPGPGGDGTFVKSAQPPALQIEPAPVLEILPWVKVTSFEYASDDGRFATLELIAELRGGVHAPTRAELRVRRAGRVTSHRALRATVDRREGSRARSNKRSSVWTVSFRLPLTVVEHPGASFEVAGAERRGFALPAPTLALPAATGMSMEWLTDRLPSAAEGLRHRRRQATALASVVALGAGLSSAATVANADSSPQGSSPGGSTTTGAVQTQTSTDTTATDTILTATTTSPTSTSPSPSTSTTTTPSDSGTLTTTVPTPTTTTISPVLTGPQTIATPPETTTTGTDAKSTTSGTGTKISTTAILKSAAKGSAALSVSGTVHGLRKVRCQPPAKQKTDRATRKDHNAIKSHGADSGSSASSTTSSTRGHGHKTTAKSANCVPATGRRHRDAHSNTKHRAGARNNGGAGLAKPAPAPVSEPFIPLTGDTSNPWGGSALADPFTSAELKFYASLVKHINLPPKYLVPIYKAAARRFHLPWQVLAAINRMETDYGADLGISSAGAEGWMQFEPATWAAYGIAVGRHFKPVDRTPNPYYPRDAIFSAARYLHASGGSHNVPGAVFAYNHAAWYVLDVLSIAQQINQHGLRWNSSGHRKIAVMRTTARLLDGMVYKWGGGHSNWMITTGYDCSGFVSMVLHSVGFLRVPATTQTLPYQRGILAGRGRWVTIYDRSDGGALEADHVIIDIKGQWWESGGSSSSGGAGSVHRINRKSISRAYLESFNLVLHPWGL